MVTRSRLKKNGGRKKVSRLEKEKGGFVEKQTVDLQTRYDSRASFYGKARVVMDGKRKTLISYNTEVAYIENGKAVVLGQWSGTTTRHIKEFLKQNGFNVENTKQMLKDYGQLPK